MLSVQGLLDNSRICQLADCQLVDWTTRGCHLRLCMFSFLGFFWYSRDCELSSPRDDQSASRQYASWRIRELSSYQCRQVQFAQRGLSLTVLPECQAFIINVLHVQALLDLLQAAACTSTNYLNTICNLYISLVSNNMTVPAECTHDIWQQVLRPQVQVPKPQVRVQLQVTSTTCLVSILSTVKYLELINIQDGGRPPS